MKLIKLTRQTIDPYLNILSLQINYEVLKVTKKLLLKAQGLETDLSNLEEGDISDKDLGDINASINYLIKNQKFRVIDSKGIELLQQNNITYENILYYLANNTHTPPHPPLLKGYYLKLKPLGWGNSVYIKEEELNWATLYKEYNYLPILIREGNNMNINKVIQAANNLEPIAYPTIADNILVEL